MKYYVMCVSNGFLQKDAITEWSDLDKAKVKYHDTCKTLWNATDVKKAIVKIFDENLENVSGYAELITHPQTSEE